MKATLVTALLMLALAASAQSIDTTTVQPSSDYLDFDRVRIEIALHQYDSVMHGDLEEYPFGIVFQDGKAGVYDFRNAKLVTEVKYTSMSYVKRQEGEDDTCHLFRFETEEACGLVLVSESDGSMMEASQKKETQEQ